MSKKAPLPQSLLEVLAEESPAACVVLTTKQQLRYCNQATRALLRGPQSPEDLPALQEALSLSVSQREQLNGLFELALTQQHIPNTPLLHNQEQARDLSVSLRRLDHWVILWFNESLPAFDQQRSNLLAVLSHEMRAPLVAIRGYTELVMTGRLGPLNERQKRGLEIALRNIGSLVDQIENMLLHSRLELGAGLGRLVRQDLVEVAKEVLHAAEPQLTEKSLTILSELPEEPIYCELDRMTFCTALRNLLSNAAKFTDQGGTIRFQLTRAHDCACILVQDSGIGISVDEFAKIFEPFYQVEGMTTRRFRGAGLGLSLTKKIINRHRGTIEVASDLEQGSRFTIVLPLAE